MRLSALIKSLLFSVFLTLFSYNSYAQSGNQILLAGKILNQESRETVAFANIYLNNTRMGVIADEDGMYRISLNPGDSILVSVMGYEDKLIKIASNNKKDLYKDIFLKPISYMLSEVDVLNLGTWQQFKQEFIHMKVVKTEKQKQTELLAKNLGLSIQQSLNEYPIAQSSGMSLGKPYAQRVKERREAYAKSEQKNRILATKYNAEIVSQIIKEKEKERIDLFMVYVNTHSSFNDKTPESLIIKTVQNLYCDFLILFPKEKISKRDTTA